MQRNLMNTNSHLRRRGTKMQCTKTLENKYNSHIQIYSEYAVMHPCGSLLSIHMPFRLLKTKIPLKCLMSLPMHCLVFYTMDISHVQFSSSVFLHDYGKRYIVCSKYSRHCTCFASVWNGLFHYCGSDDTSLVLSIVGIILHEWLVSIFDKHR